MNRTVKLRNQETRGAISGGGWVWVLVKRAAALVMSVKLMNELLK